MMATIQKLFIFIATIFLFIVIIFVFSDNSDTFKDKERPFYEDENIQIKIDKIIQLSNERLYALIKVFNLSDSEITELKKFIIDNNIDIEHEKIKSAILIMRDWKNKNETVNSRKHENNSW